MRDLRELDVLTRAADIVAQNEFGNKKDKAGKPYIEHLMRVASDFTNEGYIAAILHDLLEDCQHWSRKSVESLFGELVADVVDALTREERESYDSYITRLCNVIEGRAKGWELVYQIKMADLKDNVDVTRFDRDLMDEDIERVKRYQLAARRLKKAFEG